MPAARFEMDRRAAFEDQFDTAAAASYSYWRDETVRYSDLDTLGHVTSQAFIDFFESSRIQLLAAAGQPVDAADRVWMLVRLEIEFRAQLRFPGAVAVGTRLLRLGNSSLATAQALFDGERCAATLVSALVLVGRANERPVLLPEGLRRRLLEVSRGGA